MPNTPSGELLTAAEEAGRRRAVRRLDQRRAAARVPHLGDHLDAAVHPRLGDQLGALVGGRQVGVRRHGEQAHAHGLLADRHPAEHRDGRAGRSLQRREVVAQRGPRRRRRDRERPGLVPSNAAGAPAPVDGHVIVPDDAGHGEQAGNGHRRHGGHQQAVAHHGLAATTGTRADSSAGSANGTSPEVTACCASNTSSCGVIFGPVLRRRPCRRTPCRSRRRRGRAWSTARSGPAAGGRPCPVPRRVRPRPGATAGGAQAARPAPPSRRSRAALALRRYRCTWSRLAAIASRRPVISPVSVSSTRLGERAQLVLEPPQRARLHPARAARRQVGIGPVQLRAAELAVDERGQQVSEVTHRSRTRRSLSRCARAARS